MNLSESREIFFHGTTLRAARKILKAGLDPSQKREVVWDENEGGLKSFGGTYFAKRLNTAIHSGWQATKKFGSVPVVVEARIETRSAHFDEDVVPNMVHHMFWSFSEINKGWLLTKYSMKSLMQGDIQGGKRDVDEWVDKSIEAWVDDYFRDEPRNPALVTKIRPLLDAWVRAGIEGILKYGDSFQSKASRVAGPYIDAMKNVIDALRSEPARRLKKRFSRNIRVDDPVKFKGSNQILSVICLPFQGSIDSELRIQVKELSDSERMSIFVVYGKVSDEFIKKYEEETTGNSDYKIRSGSIQDLRKYYSDLGLDPSLFIDTKGRVYESLAGLVLDTLGVSL